MKYNRQLVQAIMWAELTSSKWWVYRLSAWASRRRVWRVNAGVPKKFVIDPHGLFSGA
jgi:glutathione-independent formaldehyde dehydrogenase